jgi:hypothetical protein
MLRLYRAIADFFAGCMEALRDDDPAPARYEARQQRWLDYLRN